MIYNYISPDEELIFEQGKDIIYFNLLTLFDTSINCIITPQLPDGITQYINYSGALSGIPTTVNPKTKYTLSTTINNEPYNLSFYITIKESQQMTVCTPIINTYNWIQYKNEIFCNNNTNDDLDYFMLNKNGNTLAYKFGKYSQNNSQVFIYNLFNNFWQQKGIIYASNVLNNIQLNDDGNIIIIPIQNNDLIEIKIYLWINNNWVLSDSITDIDININTNINYGNKINISINHDATTIAIGGISKNSNSTIINIYKKTSNWDKKTIIRDFVISYINLNLDYFGSTLICGFYNEIVSSDLNKGFVEVYSFNSNIWNLRDTIIGDNFHDKFNITSINKDGSIIAIGAPNYDYNLTDNGCVSIYQYDILSNKYKLLGNKLYGILPVERFGSFISVDDIGENISISNNYPNYITTIYKYNESTKLWEQKGCPINGYFTNVNKDGTIVGVVETIYDNSTYESTYTIRTYNWNLVLPPISTINQCHIFSANILFNKSMVLSANNNIDFEKYILKWKYKDYNNNNDNLTDIANTQNKKNILINKRGFYYLQIVDKSNNTILSTATAKIDYYIN